MAKYYLEHADALKAKTQAWNRANPRGKLSNRLTREFGITIEDYDMMLLTQNNCCAICGTDTPKGRGRFHVDHNHDTGSIRGLLCHACNTALGLFKDSPPILARAIEYLTDNGHYGPKEIEGGAEAFIN